MSDAPDYRSSRARTPLTESLPDSWSSDGPPKTTAAERLRALEDEWFGKDAPRHDGKIEQGHGSQFALLAPERRAHYRAVEAVAIVEEKVARARAALSEAEGEHAAAVKRADDTAPKVPEPKVA